jgi:hypothetical protein
MNEVKFPLFVKKNIKRINRDLLIFGSMMFSLFILWLNEEYLEISFLGPVINTVFIISLVLYPILIFYSMSEREKLDGDFVGYLVFGPQKILAKQKEVDIEILRKIEFFVYDFDGKNWNNPRSAEPKVSNGTGNEVRLITKANSTIIYNFQQNYENEFEKKMREVLISYHLQEKISFLVLIQLIGISDNYEQIQEFKKELRELNT